MASIDYKKGGTVVARSYKAPIIRLTDRQKETLQEIALAKKSEQRLHERSTIILSAASGEPTLRIAKALKMKPDTVRHWRKKWTESQDKLNSLESEEKTKKYLESIIEILSDEQRPGAPSTFTPEQVIQIIALSCELPESSGYPVSHWSAALLRLEILKRNIVPSISKTQVGRFLKRKGLSSPTK